MKSPVFSLSGGQSLNVPLPFWANGARVDNAGGQWLNFDGSPSLVGPYTINVTVRFNHAITVGKCTTIPPAGQTNDGTGSPASIVFDSDTIAPNAGIAVQPGSGTPTVTSVYNATASTGLSYPANVSAGQSLIAFIASSTNGPAFSDAAGNVWALVTQVNSGNGWLTYYFCQSTLFTPSGTAISVTNNLSLAIADVGAGLNLNGSTSVQGTNVSTLSTVPVSSSGKLFIAGAYANNGVSGQLLSFESPFTALQNASTGTRALNTATLNGGGAQSVAVDVTPAADTALILAALK